MNNKMNDTNKKNEDFKYKVTEEPTPSLNEKWEKAMAEVKKKEIEDAIQLVEEYKEEERLKVEFEKKYGKEPLPRTPDGKINKKYIDYVLRRDFGIEPDSNYTDPYENFSWGGLRGIEAYIAKWNCD